MIMTAGFYYFYTITKVSKYFYPSVGGLGTAMGYKNEVK